MTNQIGYLQNNYPPINNQTDLDLGKIAETLFNNWSKRYSEDMIEHTDAIKRLFKMQNYFWEKCFQNKPGLNLFDPAVGDGTVIRDFLKYAIKDKTKTCNLYLNDISQKMLDLCKEKFEPGLSDHNKFDHAPTAVFSKENILSKDNTFSKDNTSLFRKLNLNPFSVDVIIASQIFDLVKGYSSKRDLITFFYNILKDGGQLIVIGEEPPLFSLSSNLSKKMNEYFYMLFEGIDSDKMKHELMCTPNTYSFYVTSTVRTRIDHKHSMYLQIAEKNGS